LVVSAMTHPLALDSATSRAHAALTAIRERLKDPDLANAYAELQGKLRALCLFDPRQGEPNPKAFAKAARAASDEARRALALQGATDGVAKGVMRHLPLLELPGEDRLHAAILCAAADPEATLANLAQAGLETEAHPCWVAIAALRQQPVFDFEAYKTLETHHLSNDTGNTDLHRRYEQARSHLSQHARKHLLTLVPKPLFQQPEARFAMFHTCLARDPFGTLEHWRQAEITDPCTDLDIEQRFVLLERVAAFGLGLASTHLDLFNIPQDEAWTDRLRAVFRADLTAGFSLFGVYALEGIQNYPFGLGRIEPVLPRRITNSEAAESLKRGLAPGEKVRVYTPAEISDTAAQLQEREVRRFLEVMKSDMARQWKACMQDRKLDLLFADPELKIRNVLFLIAHALFESEDTFERIFRTVQKGHPLFASDTARILLLANRYYFLELLGLNPGLLFNRAPRGTSGAGTTLMEEASDYPVRSLLNVGMSIHLRIGDTLFRSTPIAWNIMLAQYEGRIDLALQDIAFLFEGFDTLLTIVSGLDLPDLRAWTNRLTDALVDDDAEMPLAAGSADPPRSPLRLTTRGAIERYRESLNRYCVQALRRSAEAAGVSPTNIIQGLRLPRNKTDKLRALLEQRRGAA